MVDSVPDKPTVFRNVECTVDRTRCENDGFRKDFRPILKGQFKEVFSGSYDPIDGARTDQSDTEFQRLYCRTRCQLLTRETGGKAEIVLDSRAASGLSAWAECIKYNSIQPFGSTRHSCRESRWPGASDCEVIDAIGGELFDKPELRSQLEYTRFLQDAPLPNECGRKIRRMDSVGCQHGPSDFVFCVGLDQLVGIVAAAQESPKLLDIGITGLPDQDDCADVVSEFVALAQNECA